MLWDLWARFFSPISWAGRPSWLLLRSLRWCATGWAVRAVPVRGVVCVRSSFGLVAFFSPVAGDWSAGSRGPWRFWVGDVGVVLPGIVLAVSGAKDAYVRHCDLSYTTDLPSNAPSAKHMGMRVLGMEGAQIEDVVTHGFPIAVGMDASYLAPFRLYNQDITFLRPRFYDSQTVFQIYECRGTLRITEPRTSCSLGSTDYSVFADAQTNREVSTVAGKPTELGNLIVERADVQGVSMFISQDGTMGRLEVSTNAVIGNASTSNDDKRRGAVICGGLVGFPSSTKIADNDFMMTGPDAAPSIVVGCDQPGDLVEVRGNALPESPTTTPIFANGLPAFYSDAREQRPFTGRVNLGTNSIHRVGTLAQVRDGTPMPAPAKPVVAIWTRNQVKVIEGPDNIFTKNAGGSDYDAAFWSAEKYASDFELVYRLGQISARLRVGLASNPGQAPYGNMDWCIEYQAAPNGYVLSSGAYLSLVGAYDPTTIERWRRQGSRLIFSRGGVDMFDTAVSPDTAFALQAAFARVNDSIEILRFGAI
ncbi:hypothetical protein [Sphingomonas gellani]|uniref:hypothetical protein n=1 Tax=Sphingomonas gellani TaxID=1166340 RepID=UPI001113F24C|nr:hypothetical protein [Sphingomonas gellani]